VTVENKSTKPLDRGLAYISVQSGNKAASEVFDSLSGLRGPPNTKVLKSRDRSLRSDLQLPIRRTS
jgi:hypothetical protein